MAGRACRSSGWRRLGPQAPPGTAPPGAAAAAPHQLPLPARPATAAGHPQQHQPARQLQQGGGGNHAGAEPLDGGSAVQHLLANYQHGPLLEGIATGGELAAQDLVGASIADLEARDAAAQLAQLGEVAAEQAAAVEHQQGG